MSKTIKLALAAAIPVLLLAGCADFLKGPGLNNNPNVPTTATADQLWTGVEVAVMAEWEDFGTQIFMTWSQNIAGVNRQWQTYATYNNATDASTATGSWTATYGQGGLRDIRAIEAANTASSALHWRGQVRVLEALFMGTLADIYGNVPYTDALTGTPTFDTQAAVYTHVLAVLDSAIADLTSTDTQLPSSDFFYNNSAAKWTQLAHTLKARFIMHTAQTAASTAAGVLDTYSPSSLASVLTETAAGISSAANNLLPNHTASPGSQNLFYAFQFSRAGDVAPSQRHISEIKKAGEPYLLPMFYTPNVYGNYYGSAAGLPGDSIDNISGDSVATFEVTTDPAAEYPISSYAENQMLRAEAQLRSGSGAAALVTLNLYRASQGQSAVSPAPVGTKRSWNGLVCSSVSAHCPSDSSSP